MAFQNENKITYNELAPSLQDLINSKTDSTDFSETAALVSLIYRNLGKIRVSINSNPGAIGIPINDNEILLNTSDHTVQGYSSGWYKCGGVYS